MKTVCGGQLAAGKLMRWIALSCILLALVMSGLEATHTHSDASVSRNSPPCAICLSAHANAPAVTLNLLPVFHAVEAVALPHEPEGKSAVSELRLFIRPPPLV